MAAENMDRRVRKTRTMLRLCLARLLKEKKIQEISVKEISEMADINRGTFYLHYRDVYDLLASIEDDMFRQFNGILERNIPSGEITERPSRLILELFSFIRENADLAQILMGPNGDIQFLNQLREVFKDRIMVPWAKTLHIGNEKDYQYWYAFITDGCLGLIKAWLENGTDLSPEEVADLAEKFITSGTAGLVPEEVRAKREAH